MQEIIKEHEMLINISILILVSISLIKTMRYLIHRNGYNFYLDSLLELPGTIIHESSHLFMSMILLSNIKGFSILPKREENSITYGYVLQAPKVPINNFFIGLAPILLNMILFFTIIYISNININFSLINTNDITVMNIIITYLFTIILSSSIPSSQDLKVAIQGLFSISGLIFSIFIYIIINYFNNELSIYINEINELVFNVENQKIIFNLLINSIFLSVGLLSIIAIFKR